MALSRLDIRAWRQTNQSSAKRGSHVNRAFVGNDYLTDKQKAMLARRFQSGDSSAGERLLSASLGQVLSYAAKYSDSAIPIKDLIQEGRIGVLHACQTYNPKQKAPFSVLASSLIKRQIESVINSGARELGTLLPAAASVINNDPREILSIGSFKMPKCLARTMLDKMISRLRDREAQVIRLRYGLDGNGPSTNAEAGNLLKVCGGRICQIEAHALRMLRAKEPRRLETFNISIEMPDRTPSQVTLTFLEKMNVRRLLRLNFTPKESQIMLQRLDFGFRERMLSRIDDVSRKHKISEREIREIEGRALALLDDPFLQARLNILLYPDGRPVIASGLKNLASWSSILF